MRSEVHVGKTRLHEELARAAPRCAPKDSHPFVVRIGVPAVAPIAHGPRQQIATFFTSNAELIIHPEPRRFLAPIVLPLPQDLNYIP